MKYVLMTVLFAMILSVAQSVPMIPPPACGFEIPAVCSYALYNPTYASMCIALIMFELWDPLDWGD